MDDQASVKPRNGTESNGVLGSLTEFGNNVASLAELQLKLAALDAKASAERVALPAGLAAGGLAVLLGTVPVLLLGAAALVAPALHIAEGWAMLLVAGVALVVSAAVVVLAGRQISRAFDSFQRSRDELTRNVAWIRTVLLYSGRPATRRD